MNMVAAATIAAGLLIASVGQAAELHPMQGGTVQLGRVSGAIYYTAKPDGYRLVATLSSRPEDPPVRFVATLLPGQAVTLSVSRGAGEKPAEVMIQRMGDRLVYSQSVLAGTPTD